MSVNRDNREGSDQFLIIFKMMYRFLFDFEGVFVYFFVFFGIYLLHLWSLKNIRWDLTLFVLTLFANFFLFIFYPLLFLLFFFLFLKVFFIFDPETETYDSMFLDVCSEKRMLFGLASCLSVHNCNFGYTHTCKAKKKIEISGFFEILR